MNHGELDFAKFVDLSIWNESRQTLTCQRNSMEIFEVRRATLWKSGRSATSTDPREVGGCQDGGSARATSAARAALESRKRTDTASNLYAKKTMGNMFYVLSYWGNLGKHWETEGNGLLSNAELKITLPGQAEGGLDLRDFHFQEQTINTRLTNSKRAHYPTRSYKVHV